MAHIKNAIVVSSIDGLYDEKAEAILSHINDRKKCVWKHDLVNASLYWGSKKDDKGSYFSINLESPKSQFSCAWGMGYGGIRYCKRCKLIDCIHLWEEELEKVYEIEKGKYYSEGYSIKTCRVCERRILCSSWGSAQPSRRAFELLSQAAHELGKDLNKYPSGWHVELPIYISEMIDSQGEAVAMDCARRAFMDTELGRNIMGVTQ